MSGKMGRDNSLLLFAVVAYLHAFRACDSVSLLHQDRSEERIAPDNPHLKSTEVRPQSADPLPYFRAAELGGDGFTLDNRTWTVGVSRRPRSSVSKSADGEQTDFTG